MGYPCMNEIPCFLPALSDRDGLSEQPQIVIFEYCMRNV